MNDFLIGLLSNVIWVLAVFAWITIRDRQRRRQELRCLEAGMVRMVRSAGLVRDTVWPYVHLVKNRTSDGTLLGIALAEVGSVLREIAGQLQQMLALSRTDAGQAALLKAYSDVTAFQATVAASRVAANIVVGNPVALVEPPSGDAEISRYGNFARGWAGLVRQVLAAAPTDVRAAIPADALAALDTKSALEQALA